MKFVGKDDIKTLNDLEKDVKNKFSLHWYSKIDGTGQVIAQWCKKINVPGECYCIWCHKVIKYQSGGLKCLVSHSESAQHAVAAKSVRDTVTLFSYGAENVEESKSTVDLNSRKVRIESTICAFLAEHSLPFTAGPQLLELAKMLSKDSKALQSTNMCRTTVAYKMKFGLAKTIKEELIQSLRTNAFSLNIDESTSRAHKSILTVLVQYFSPERIKVFIQHFASLELFVCTSSNIFDQIVILIDDNGIPWKNLISVLFDSCNTMRGVKSGVEALIRKNKASHLLSIGGDTCHTVNNSAKKFAEIFDKNIEDLCDMLHFDLQSVHQRSLFFSIRQILGIKKLVPISRPDHRWIYVLPAIERILLLWDALLVHYISWAKVSDQELYKNQLQEIYKRRNVQRCSVKKLKKIQAVLKSKNLTTPGKDRKEKIIDKLFVHQKQTLLEANAYKDIFPVFSNYIKLFQSKKPLIHELHAEMFMLIKKIMSFFINHNLISGFKSCKDLKKIDTGDETNHLPDSLVYVGAGAKKLISEWKTNDHKVSSFKSALKKAYIRCTKYLVEKLPYDNSALIAFTSLNPELRGEMTTFTGFLKMSDLMVSILTPDEKNELDEEIRAYQIDDKITVNMSHDFSLKDNMGEIKTPKRIDEFWAEIFEMSSSLGAKKYRIIEKLVKAALSCFHGPVVEGAFSLMENTITDHRSSLDIEGLDSYQTIKYFLTANNKTSLEAFYSTECPETHPVEKHLLTNMINSKREYGDHLKRKREEAEKGENLALGSSPTKSNSKNYENLALSSTSNKFQILKIKNSKDDENLLLNSTSNKFHIPTLNHSTNVCHDSGEKASHKVVANESISLQSHTGIETNILSPPTKKIKPEQPPKKQASLTSFFKRK